MSSTNDFIITNENVLFQYAGPGGEVIIPEGVKKIGSCSFKNCSTITSVSLPVSLEEIEDFAFQNCTALESVSVPGTLK